MCTYLTGLGRVINKFDIYYCDFGAFDKKDTSATISKVRPAVIVSSAKMNNPKANVYHVVPIRTESQIKFNSIEEVVKERRKTGHIYIPIELEVGRMSFIDVSQLTILESKNVLNYRTSILDQEFKNKINAAIRELLFDDGELETESIDNVIKEITAVEEVKEVIPKTIPVIEDDEKPISKTTSRTRKNTTRVFNGYPDGFLELIPMYLSGEITQKGIANKLGRSQGNINAYVKKYRQEFQEKIEADSPSFKEYKNTNLDDKFNTDFTSNYKKMKSNMITKNMMATNLGITMANLRSLISEYETLNA